MSERVVWVVQYFQCGWHKSEKEIYDNEKDAKRAAKILRRLNPRMAFRAAKESAQ